MVHYRYSSFAARWQYKSHSDDHLDVFIYDYNVLFIFVVRQYHVYNFSVCPISPYVIAGVTLQRTTVYIHNIIIVHWYAPCTVHTRLQWVWHQWITRCTCVTHVVPLQCTRSVHSTRYFTQLLTVAVSFKYCSILVLCGRHRFWYEICLVLLVPSAWHSVAHITFASQTDENEWQNYIFACLRLLLIFV